jgi:hypothetical protein
MIKNVLIGADPELFLEKEGIIVSAEGIIGGTKYEPLEIDYKDHYIQEDNVMIEFNIAPSVDRESFVHSINYVKDYLKTLVGIKGYTLNFSSSSFLDSKYLKTPQAKTFGCDPDLNVYAKRPNTSPNSKTNLRTCGGHIHIGYNNPNVEDSEKIVYGMDMLLGLDSLILDSDSRRRSMYGKAGSFRFKEYGVEYRVLSNFWIRNDKSIEWVFDRTNKVISLINSNVMDNLIDKFASEVEYIINNNNVEASLEMSSKIEEEINKQIKILN